MHLRQLSNAPTIFTWPDFCVRFCHGFKHGLISLSGANLCPTQFPRRQNVILFCLCRVFGALYQKKTNLYMLWTAMLWARTKSLSMTALLVLVNSSHPCIITGMAMQLYGCHVIFLLLLPGKCLAVHSFPGRISLYHLMSLILLETIKFKHTSSY